MRVLLAEDDPDSRECLGRILRARGWEVFVEETGEAVRQAFAAQPFPLVLLSTELPDADGLEVCRAIRDSPLGRAAFVFLISTDDGPALVRRMIAVGADDYLPRPLSPVHAEGRIALAECRLLVDGECQGSPTPRAPSYPQRIAELEEAQRVQRALLEELFHSAPEGVIVVDADDRVMQANGEFCRMFGFSMQEVIGQPINDLIVPDDLRDEGLQVTHGVLEGKRITLETLRCRKDGTRIDVSLLATPVSAGGYIGAYGIYRDITERKRSERALRESEARYRALFDQLPVGVFLCDSELRITHCNPRLPRMMRSSAGQIVGISLRDLRDQRILPAMEQALRGEPTVYEGPYQATTSDAEVWVSVRFAPLRDADGRVVGGMGVVEDITEREHAEQRLRAQAAELERVNAALRERSLEVEAAMQARSRLYTTMNHELRTPISAIMLYQELLLSGTLGELAPDQAEALEHAHRAAQHLLDLVRDVLDLSKLEAGRVRIQPAEVSVPGLLRDLRATLLPLARRHGSEIQLDLCPEPLSLVTDPQRVRQILLNFVSNAAKFGRGRPIVLRAHPAGDEVVLEVVDQGVGIGPDDLPHIFEDFVQLGHTQEGGTGLGLAISRRLSELLQGRLEVESAPGEGSTFRLILPRVLGTSTPAATHGTD